MEKTKIIYSLVIPDRMHLRMQPELYYAFKTTARNMFGQQLSFRFTMFNPFLAHEMAPGPWCELQKEVLRLLSYIIGYVVDIKRTTNRKSLFNAIMIYIDKNPNSSLAILYRKLEKAMYNYSFLVIESTGKTVLHPIYYQKNVHDSEAGIATADDIKDSLYGLFFIDIALKQQKPIFGTCHGAQLGYLHAGGGIKRIFENANTPEFIAYYPRRNPYGGPNEVWQINDMLNARDINDHYKIPLLKYPLPDIFRKPGDKKDERYINRDFNHTLAMTTPVPKCIDVISYHPLSFLKRQKEHEITDAEKEYPQITKTSIDKFKSSIKINTIVDIFRYKTLWAFQHHPHYAYDDVDNVAIFEFLLKDICRQLKINIKPINQ